MTTSTTRRPPRPEDRISAPSRPVLPGSTASTATAGQTVLPARPATRWSRIKDAYRSEPVIAITVPIHARQLDALEWAANQTTSNTEYRDWKYSLKNKTWWLQTLSAIFAMGLISTLMFGVAYISFIAFCDFLGKLLEATVSAHA
jgi:hypothetical protein